MGILRIDYFPKTMLCLAAIATGTPRVSAGAGINSTDATSTLSSAGTIAKNATVSTNASYPSITVFKESRLAHAFLDGLSGIEIGGAVHNPFGLHTLNVDYTSGETKFTEGQRNLTGRVAKVDIEARANRLPLGNGSKDFIVNSHVLEHLYDPVSTVKEWMRVLKRRSLIYIILPHMQRTFDRGARESTVIELLARYAAKSPPKGVENEFAHFSFWTLHSFVKLALARNWHIVALQNVDDKAGNGFTIVLKKD